LTVTNRLWPRSGIGATIPPLSHLKNKQTITMATQEIKELLLEAGPFARLSATEQRTRLVTYYQSWFRSDFKIDTVNNIRASQRITSHARSMALPVGVVLQAILLEASGIEPSSRGLLGVPADAAPECCIPDSDLVSSGQQAEGVSGDTPGAAVIPAISPPPVPEVAHAPDSSKRRSNRVK
jgi:hypothetical protein